MRLYSWVNFSSLEKVVCGAPEGAAFRLADQGPERLDVVGDRALRVLGSVVFQHDVARVFRVAEDTDVSFIVVDLSDRAVSSALPIIYDAAFHKKRFALVNAVDLYQEILAECHLLSQRG